MTTTSAITHSACGASMFGHSMPVTCSVARLAVTSACLCDELRTAQRPTLPCKPVTCTVARLAVTSACLCDELRTAQRPTLPCKPVTCTVARLAVTSACLCDELRTAQRPTLPCKPALLPCTGAPAPAPAPACTRARRSTVKRIDGQRQEKSTACAHVLDGQRPGQSTVNGFYFLRSTVTPGKVDAVNGQRLIAINGQRNLTDTMKCSTILLVKQIVHTSGGRRPWK
jgi:hypothetical protein